MPKWSEGFRFAVSQATGSERFTYLTAVARLSGDRSAWESYEPFRAALGGNPLKIVTFREMVQEIQGKLTTTLALSVIRSLWQPSASYCIEKRKIRDFTEFEAS